MGLDKREAAERLLVQAIKLHFNDGDPYPIHLLLMSALRICRDVLKSKGFTDDIEKIIKPEFRNQFYAIFYSIASFFKHADRDPNAFLEPSPDLEKGNELLVIIVAEFLKDAFGTINKNLYVHLATLYNMKKYPSYFLFEDGAKPVWDKTLNTCDAHQIHDLIRTAVKQGPLVLGGEDQMNGWTWGFSKN